MSLNEPPKPLPYASKGDLTTGPVQGHLIRLSVPMVWAMLTLLSVQLVDAYFISLLGNDELAGISFTFPVTMFLSHLVFGFNIAMSSVVSRLIGEKRIDDSRRVTLHGIILSFIVSCVISVVAYFSLNPVFRMLGADETSMRVVMDYMPVWLIAAAILAVPTNINSALRAAGDTFIPSLIMISIAVVNVIIVPFFVFGWAGLPDFGVKGAAIGTLIAYIWGAGAALYVLVFIKSMVPTDGLHLAAFKDSVRRLIVIAIPASMGNIIMPATTAIITAILATHGPEAVAAYGVASRVEALSMVVVLALAMGMAPLVGQNWGAGHFARVHESIRLAMSINMVWCFFMAVIFFVFAHPIAAAFSTDTAIIKGVIMYLTIVPITSGFGNIAFGWSSAFNAMGAPQRSFMIIFTRAFVMAVPAAWAGGMLYGVAGVFVATALVNVASGVLFHLLSWRTCQRDEARRVSGATA